MLFRISDTGVGMDDEKLSRVFEAFAQADASISRKYGGTGLGLTISQSFCKMMGGEITADSRPGEGSEFTVRIPARVTAGAREQDAEPQQSEPLPAGPAVLVIDDDPNVRDLMTRLLQRDGYQVVTAADADTGIRRAREIHPVAITLDVIMPGKDGWTVLAELKADSELASIPVVMITILDDEQLGYALGANGFLTKPVDREQLRAVLAAFRRDGERSVMLVEDDAESRDVLSRALASDGWMVTAAENGRVALDLLPETRPDVILLDLMMPEMDGFEFVEALGENEHWRRIPVIVLTAKELTLEELKELRRRTPSGRYVDPASFFRLHGYARLGLAEVGDELGSEPSRTPQILLSGISPRTGRNESGFVGDAALFIAGEAFEGFSGALELHFVGNALDPVLTEARAIWEVLDGGEDGRMAFRVAGGRYWWPFGIHNAEWFSALNRFSAISPAAAEVVPAHYNELGIMGEGEILLSPRLGLNFILSVGNGVSKLRDRRHRHSECVRS